MKSILNTEKGVCYLCGRHGATEEHHVFYGTANRKLSEKYGLKVNLCHECHNEPPFGVHFFRARDLELMAETQLFAMEHYNWTVEDFIRIFGRNYCD